MEEPARTSRSGQVRCLAPPIDLSMRVSTWLGSDVAESSRSSSRRSMTRRSRTLRPGWPTRCTSNACSQPSTHPSGRSSCCTTTSTSRCPRRPLRWASRSGPQSPASTGRSPRCGSRLPTTSVLVALGCPGAFRMSHSDTTPRTLTADRLSSAFNEVGGQARPDYLPDIVAQAGRTRQRPAWTFLERWLPMDIAVRRQGVPRAVLVFAVLALLITLLVATVAFIGTTAKPASPGGRDQRPPCLRERRRHHRRRAGRNRAAHPDQRCVGDGWDGVSPRTVGVWRTGPRPWPGATWDLIVVDADGGSPVIVASGVSAAFDPSQPAWSPNGATIAYSAATPQPDGSACQTAQNGSFCTIEDLPRGRRRLRRTTDR